MYTKARPLCVLFTRNPPETQGCIQNESEGLEKDIPCKWKSKERDKEETKKDTT